MSLQISYFGANDATNFILEQLRIAFGPIRVVKAFSDDPILSIVDIDSFETQSSGQASILAVLLGDDLERIVTRECSNGLKRIDFQESFAVEWIPAIATPNVANVGRLYAANQDVRIGRSMARLLRAIKRECESITYGHRYWIFPEVAGVPTLRGEVGVVFRNPLLGL